MLCSRVAPSITLPEKYWPQPFAVRDSMLLETSLTHWGHRFPTSITRAWWPVEKRNGCSASRNALGSLSMLGTGPLQDGCVSKLPWLQLSFAKYGLAPEKEDFGFG